MLAGRCRTWHPSRCRTARRCTHQHLRARPRAARDGHRTPGVRWQQPGEPHRAHPRLRPARAAHARAHRTSRAQPRGAGVLGEGSRRPLAVGARCAPVARLDPLECELGAGGHRVERRLDPVDTVGGAGRRHHRRRQCLAAPGEHLRSPGTSPAVPGRPGRCRLEALDVPELSPDGTRLAYGAVQKGTRHLFVHDLQTQTATALPGTTGATFPFWAPDGAAHRVLRPGALRRVSATGGAPHTLAPAALGSGGAWAGDTILFAPTRTGALHRMGLQESTSTPVGTMGDAGARPAGFGCRRSCRMAIATSPSRWPTRAACTSVRCAKDGSAT